LCAELGNPIAKNLSARSFAIYRGKRLDTGLTPKTLNNELTYLLAVYNGMAKIGELDYPCPLAKVTKLKQQERELHYLTCEQIAELRRATRHSKDPARLLAIIDLCLATGARWGEAESLTPTQVGADRVTYARTKSKKNRSVQIAPELAARIRPLLPFGSKLDAFDKVLRKCSFSLPRGQSSHVLRHTFASHFVMDGGNLLALQRILGHSEITMTMRYAHLSPDYAKEAVTFNPLNKLGQYMDNPENSYP